MLKKLYVVCLLLTTICVGQKRKVLLIGIDGLQFEQIAKAQTPNFDSFTIKKAFTGGLIGTASEQVTSSGPSWITILTGVWTNKHQITSNSKEQVSKAPSVFNLLKASNTALTTASISTWKNINLLLYKDMYDVDFATQGGTDALSTNLAINYLETKAPDFTFLHLDDIDHAGHAVGFGKKYTEAIEKVDAQIGRLLETIRKREINQQEDWLVLLVTDHGRDAVGKGHGNQTLSEKTIFIGMNKKGNNYFQSIQNTKKVRSLRELESFIPQTSVVPTILKFLQLPIKKEWKLEGKSLVNY